MSAYTLATQRTSRGRMIDSDIVYDIISTVGTYDKLKAGKPLTVREAESLLKDFGFRMDHIRGSHHHWIREGDIFTLPVHGKELKTWVTRELRKLYEKKNKH